MHQSRPSLIPVCPCLALTMSLLLLAGLAGCGPASSENAPSARTDTVASAASSATERPAPLASDNGNGSVTEKGKVPVGDSSKAGPTTPSTKPTNPMDDLVVPSWIAKDLNSPDAGTRLQALETWVMFAPAGSVDPLIQAYVKNDDDRVRARAMELIEQDWARTAGGGE
jgi:hypothetical protein